MKKIKVFCGYTNTAGVAYTVAEGLRRNGIKADSVVISEHEFSFPYHKKIWFASSGRTFINRLLKYFYFIKHVLSYNVFIFNSRSTLLSRKLDLLILKLLGKKTAMIYTGCDIRDKNYYLNSEGKYTICKNCTDAYQKKLNCVMDIKLKETHKIQKYIHASFAHPFDAMILNGKFNYYYVPLELEKYEPVYNLNKRIKIVHSPSDDGVKGTKYVIEAIEKLREEGIDFEFELIRNKPNYYVINTIKNSDIVIDQVVLGYYALLSIEAMALGKTVVCYIKDKLYDYLPDIPIVNLNPDNLAEGLKELITDRNKLISYGKLGRAFVEKYHDYKKISAQMIKIIINSN